MLLQKETCAIVDIHPDDAGPLGIGNGDQIEITSPRGKITLEGQISQDIKPGMVRIAWGWGETEPAANLNSLTDDHRRNPITGTPGNRSFMCRIRKLGN
jgi:anaerobic selenocysteine-containing dehydrogenase